MNKSKFLGFGFFVKNLNEIKYILKQMHNNYPDASHICYAYILQDSKKDFYYSDDGEPSKTAGLPIFNLMKQNKLLYSMIVVVRYFGGIKLGTTNLKKAFLSTADDLLNNKNLCMIKKTSLYKLKASYSQIKKISAQFKNQIVDKKFNDLDVIFFIAIDKKQEEWLVNYDSKLVDDNYIVKML